MSDCPYCGRPMPARSGHGRGFDRDSDRDFESHSVHDQHYQHGRGPFRAADGGKVFGVCAGIADHFGWSRTVVRLIALVALVFFFPAVLIVYLLAALLMDRAKEPHCPV